MKRWLLLGLAPLMLPLVYAAPQISGTPDEVRAYVKPSPRSVVIQGQAERYSHSDRAHVTLAVVTREKTLTEALERNAEIRSDLVQAALNQGIPQDHINNTQFSTSPQYGWFGKRPTQFEVVNRVKVTASNERQLIFLAGVSDADEAVSVSDIAFEDSRKKLIESEVRLAAMADAKEKGYATAAALGLKVQPVSFGLHEAMPRPRFHAIRGEIIEEVVVTASNIRGPKVADMTPAPVSFDERKYEATVTVEFQIVED
ncbi:MAG: SIMPL domain-containing protein [Pseudomonadota bacterium]